MTTGGDVVAQNLARVRARIAAACRQCGRDASSVELLAVSKTWPASAVRAAWTAGQRAFGENRVQELVAKAAGVPDLAGLRWHLIGSLQTNKVRALVAVPGLALLHSLDRVRLADELQRDLAGTGRRLAALLQVHATDEPTKHGVAPAEAPALLAHVRSRCPAIDVVGVMAMGPLSGDPSGAFRRVAALHEDLQQRAGMALPVRSLGMSGDLEAAIAAGSTLVRIGTAVFGARG